MGCFALSLSLSPASPPSSFSRSSSSSSSAPLAFPLLALRLISSYLVLSFFFLISIFLFFFFVVLFFFFFVARARAGAVRNRCFAAQLGANNEVYRFARWRENSLSGSWPRPMTHESSAFRAVVPVLLVLRLRLDLLVRRVFLCVLLLVFSLVSRARCRGSSSSSASSFSALSLLWMRPRPLLLQPSLTLCLPPSPPFLLLGASIRAKVKKKRVPALRALIGQLLLARTSANRASGLVAQLGNVYAMGHSPPGRCRREGKGRSEGLARI